MTSKEYKRRLENELINEFIKKFSEKIGYTPVIITDRGSNETDYKVLSLRELEDCFDPFLPVVRDRVIKLKPQSRYREIKDLRHIYCFIAKLMKHTYTSIGRYLNRDHTTVIHSVKTFRNLYQTDESFKIKYINIINHIKEKHESSIVENLNKI